MNSIGIINYRDNKWFEELLDNKNIFYTTTEDSIDTIKDSNNIFVFTNITLTTDNRLDSKEIDELIENLGYCFENDITITNKNIILCTPTNIGTIDQIYNMLSSWNVNLVYIPNLYDYNSKQYTISGNNSDVVRSVMSFIGTLNKGVSFYETNLKSSEMFIYLSTHKKVWDNMFDMFTNQTFQSLSLSEDIGIFNHYLGYKKHELSHSDIVISQVFDNWSKTNPDLYSVYNLVGDIESIYTNFVIKGIESRYPDKTQPLGFTNIITKDKTSLNPNKMYIIYKLVDMGYFIDVYDDLSVIKNTKIYQKIEDNYKDRIKFIVKNNNTEYKNIISL
jgi:L-rhamnose mutarotase